MNDWSPERIAAHNARVAAEAGLLKRREKAPAPEAPYVHPVEIIDPTSPEDRLNKTEQRYLLLLKARGFRDVHTHAIRFRLAGKCYYTPEFYCFHEGRNIVWETKGAHIWEDGIIKLKAVAVLFPAFTFIKAQWINGAWKEQTINL